MPINEEFLTGELKVYGHFLSSTFKEVDIIPIGDVHFGDPLFSYTHFKRTIEAIQAHPYCFTILTGDLCDTVIRESVGDIYKQIKTPQDQRDWIIEQLEPIKLKILGMVNGNHERRIYNVAGFDLSKDIAEHFDIPYRDEGMIIRIYFGKGYNRHLQKPYIYDIYVTHGYGGARTSGARVAKIVRTSTYVDADVYVMSHDHAVNVEPTTYLQGGNRLVQDKKTSFWIAPVIAKPRMLVKTNAYTKWGGYGERNGFAPTNLTAPIIKLMGNKESKEVKVEVSSG